MKFSSNTRKTPVAVLGGLRDEGLENPTPMKEQENTMIIAHPMSPAKCIKAQQELAKLDLPALAQGTVLDLVQAARRIGISPSELLRQLDTESEQ